MWDERLNQTGIRLGAPVGPLVARSQLFACPTTDVDNEIAYIGPNEVPWRVRVTDGTISAIWYRGSIAELLPQIAPNLWEQQEIETAVDSLLKRTDDKREGDKLWVFFRQLALALSGVIRY